MPIPALSEALFEPVSVDEARIEFDGVYGLSTVMDFCGRWKIAPTSTVYAA